MESTGAPAPAPAPFDAPYVVVGQAPSSDLRLDHKDVSERHALLQWVGGRLHVLDLGSRTGVLYEGRRQRAGWLDPGQTIRIGPYRIAIAAGGGGVPSDPAPATPALALDIKLRGIRAVTARAETPLAVLGSAPECDVRLLDPAVSSYHCALVNTPLGSWAVDLLGTGGITVNGENVRSARLSAGDAITIGRSTVRIAQVEWPEAPGDRTVDAPSAEPVESRASTAEEPPASAEHRPQTEAVVEPPQEAVVPAEETAPTLAGDASGHLDQPDPLGESAPEPQPAAEPRRIGFFSPWRRTPVPTRASTAPAPAPAPLQESAAPAPRWSAPLPAASIPDEPVRAPSRRQEPVPAKSGWTPPPAYEPDPVSAPGAERRASCRYTVAGRTAQISWWEAVGSAMAGRAHGGGLPTRVQTQGFRGASSRDDGGGPDASHNRWVPIQIIDVSNAGLAALSAVVPPRGERIWFRLEDDPGVEWVEISVVGSSPSGSQHLVRFAFRDNCPYDLFKALVLNGGPVRS